MYIIPYIYLSNKKIGGDSILLYVLSDDRYKSYLKVNGLRYIPKIFLPMYMPKTIGNITKGEYEVGRVVGINTKPFKFEDSDGYIRFTEALNKVKLDTDTIIYIENYQSYPLEFFKFIEDITELKFSSGDNIRTFNITMLLSEITRKLSQDLHTADTLIVCDSYEKIIEIIKRLSNVINFFTVIGVDSSKKEDVYNNVFESTGISIFQPNNIEKIIKNYSTIINTMEEISFDIGNIRNQSIIIDFSCNKPFKNIINSKKNCIYVEDINFKVSGYNDWVKEYISPELFEGLMEEDTKFSQIYTNKDYYYLDDYIKNKIKIKGRI